MTRQLVKRDGKSQTMKVSTWQEGYAPDLRKNRDETNAAGLFIQEASFINRTLCVGMHLPIKITWYNAIYTHVRSIYRIYSIYISEIKYLSFVRLFASAKRIRRNYELTPLILGYNTKIRFRTWHTSISQSREHVRSHRHVQTEKLTKSFHKRSGWQYCVSQLCCLS